MPCVLLSDRIKSRTILLHPFWDMNHPLIQVISSHVGYQLSWYLRACVQVTFIFLNNVTFT